MAITQRTAVHSTSSTTVADLLERVLDKGIVIAGDIRIKLVEVELLTLEIRLLVCSVDKALEMGLDWWRGNPAFDSSARQTRSEIGKQVAAGLSPEEISARPAAREREHDPADTGLEQRLAKLEALMERVASASAAVPRP